MAPKRKQIAQPARSGAPNPIMYQQMAPGFRSNMNYSQGQLIPDASLMAQRQLLQPMPGFDSNQQMVIPPYFNPDSNLPPPPPQSIAGQLGQGNMAGQVMTNSQVHQYYAGVGTASPSMNSPHMNVAQSTMRYAGNGGMGNSLMTTYQSPQYNNDFASTGNYMTSSPTNVAQNTVEFAGNGNAANPVMANYQPPQYNNGIAITGNPLNFSQMGISPMNTPLMNATQNTMGQAGNGNETNPVTTMNRPRRYKTRSPTKGSTTDSPRMSSTQHTMEHTRNSNVVNSGMANGQPAQYNHGFGINGPSMTTPSMNTPQPRMGHARNGSTANSIMANINPPQYVTGFIGSPANAYTGNGLPTTMGYTMNGIATTPLMTNAGLPQNGMEFGGPSYNGFAPELSATPSAGPGTYQSPYSSSTTGSSPNVSPPNIGWAGNGNASTSPMANTNQLQYTMGFTPPRPLNPHKSPSKRKPRKGKAAESRVLAPPTPPYQTLHEGQGEILTGDFQTPTPKRRRLSLVTPNRSPSKVFIKDGQVYLNPKGQTLANLANNDSSTTVITVPVPVSVPETNNAAWNVAAPVRAPYFNQAPTYSLPVNTASFDPAPISTASFRQASVNTASFNQAPANTSSFNQVPVNTAPLDPAQNLATPDDAAILEFMLQTNEIALDFTDEEWALGPPNFDENGYPTWPDRTPSNQPQVNYMAAPLENWQNHGMSGGNQPDTLAGVTGNASMTNLGVFFPEFQNGDQSQQISFPQIDPSLLQMDAANQSELSYNWGPSGQNIANLDDKAEEPSAADLNLFIQQMEADLARNEYSQATETVVSQEVGNVNGIASGSNIAPMVSSAPNVQPGETETPDPVTFLKEVGNAGQIQPRNAMAFLQSAFGFGTPSNDFLDSLNGSSGQASTAGIGAHGKETETDKHSQANNMVAPEKINDSPNADLHALFEEPEAENAASPDTPASTPLKTPVASAADPAATWHLTTDVSSEEGGSFADYSAETLASTSLGPEWDDFDKEVEFAFDDYLVDM